MRKIFFTCVWVLFAASNAAAQPSVVWQEIDHSDGILVSRAQMAGSSIYGFRGEAVIDAPIGRIYDVLADREHRTEWVDRLVKSENIEVLSPDEAVIYQVFGLPWPIADRDYVYRAVCTRSGDQKVVIDIASVEHSKAPATVGVRGELYHSQYVLTAIDNQSTKVEVEIHTDPKGEIPDWLVNLIQKSWPKKTLEGIKMQVKKPFVIDRKLPMIAH